MGRCRVVSVSLSRLYGFHLNRYQITIFFVSFFSFGSTEAWHGSWCFEG